MITIEQLYAQEDPVQLKKTWDKFIFLNPGFSFLKRETTTQAIQEDDHSFPLNAFQFALFPDESVDGAQERLHQCMNRGIRAVNELSGRYLDSVVNEVVQLREIPSPFDFFEFVKTAREHWERAFLKRRRVDPEGRAVAYSYLQAIEFGYRVGMIDSCPEVLNSLRHFGTATSRLERFIGFSDPQITPREDYPVEWSTQAKVLVYSSDGNIPMRKRVKYRAGNDSSEPRYSSILMKMYAQLEFPDEINDYLGVEIITKDDPASDGLLSFFRRNARPAGILERFKDSSVGKQPGQASSAEFKVKKFLLRVPVRIDDVSEPQTGRAYQSVPIEVQILTYKDAMNRDAVPEISHVEYKRRQFLGVFPAWFPREIYEPLLRAKGIS